MQNNIKKIDKCYGCSACLNICPQKCISMHPNKRGFLEPVIDEERCINCGACLRVCPRLKDYRKEINKKIPAFVVKNNNENVRNNSSSGGFFSIIADYVIEKSGVIYGCIVDKDLEIKHVRTEKDYTKMRGSKYVKSNLGYIFKDIKEDLLKNRLVLFTGTPCECAGLKSFLGKVYDNLIIMDFICHGPQSPLIWKEYINYLSKRNGKIKNYYFRSKINGWHKHTELVEYENGKKEYDTLDTNINKELFHLGYSLRTACYDCKFTNLNRQSDLTMGDAWGIDKINNNFDDNLGTNIIIINTSKGQKIFEEIKEKISYLEVNIDDYIPYNPRLKCSRPVDKNKIDQFWEIYYKKGFKGIISKYTGYSFSKRIKKLIKNILIKLHLYKN